jgi:hypothetical protein
MTANRNDSEYGSNGKDVAVQSPSDMIKLAITGGADLEKLEKLLSLQREWERNEARKAYNQAMAEFKANPPQIDKDKTVSFGAGKTAYKHASLYNVTQKISQELSKHGLSAQWTTKQEGEQIGVMCTITHKLGHSESTMLSAKADTSGSKNPIQAIGSTVTYLERYTILALTGLATFDDDTDGVVDEWITESQLGQVIDMIADTGTDEAKFLSYMKIESLEKMPKAKFQQAVAALEDKKRKVSK